MKTMKQVLGILVAFAVAFSLVPAGSCAYAETIRSAAADADISVVGARVGYVEPGTQHYVFDPQETGAFLGKRGDTVQLLPIVVWSTGSAEYVADAGISVSWESEDPSIVTVDANGVARAKRCGATNVTMRLPSSWGGASASIAVAVGVWDGPSLENLEVFVDGLSFVSSGVYELPSSMEVGDTVQLKATATYSDGTVLRTWKDQEIPGLEWWIDYDEWASVDRDTGLLTVLGEGSTTVCASAPAGDGDSISSHVYVVYEKSGKPDGILAPSATLAVHVMRDGNRGVDEELFSRIYSASDVASLCEERWIGLQMQAPGLFKTIVSEGIPVCSLVEEQGVDLQDVVRYYAFIPGREVIPYAVERLNEDGFYFPNADIGFAAEAQRAPAVLSYASHETLNSLVPYEGELDASYRFHLVVASRALNDYISEQPVSGISDFYIVVGRDCDL